MENKVIEVTSCPVGGEGWCPFYDSEYSECNVTNERIGWAGYTFPENCPLKTNSITIKIKE